MFYSFTRVQKTFIILLFIKLKKYSSFRYRTAYYVRFKRISQHMYIAYIFVVRGKEIQDSRNSCDNRTDYI